MLYKKAYCCKVNDDWFVSVWMGLILSMLKLNERGDVRYVLRTAIVGVVLVTVVGCASVDGGSVGVQSEQAQMDNLQKTLYGAGREAETSNNYEVAAGIYGRLFEQRPDDPAILSAFVRNMRYSGRSREIIDYVQAKAPQLLANAQVKFEYAKALLAAGRKAEALTTLSQVEALTPGDWRVLSAQGITYDALGRYEEAIATYAAALKLSPDNVVVMNNMAMSQAISGQLTTAIATLERAAGINRTNTHVRQNLALLYAINGDVERAQALAAMDLDVSDVETNLSFYRRFEGQSR